MSSCGYFRVFCCLFWATRTCKSDWWLNIFCGSRNVLAEKCTESMRTSSFCLLCVVQCHFDSPSLKHYLRCHSGSSGGDSLSALTLCLCTFFPCRLLGTAWWGNPTWSKCLTLECPGNATEAAYAPCRAVMGWGRLLSTLPSFPGLSLMTSIPAPQVPSFQSSGLLQRCSPTATIAPNLMFGHLVRTSCQDRKKSNRKPTGSVLK